MKLGGCSVVGFVQAIFLDSTKSILLRILFADEGETSE